MPRKPAILYPNIMEIITATRNQKKIQEIKRILKGTDIILLSIDDFPNYSEVEETGKTFEENSIKKAITIARFTGKPTIADDSGLEVYALKGAPGIFSARYAGQYSTDIDNINKLLKEMKSISDRRARFLCVIALAYPEGSVKTFYGSVEGSIAKKPKGTSGFGYDPVFYPKGYKRTFAEMSHQEKDSLSHRAVALKKFKNYLKRQLRLAKS